MFAASCLVAKIITKPMSTERLMLLQDPEEAHDAIITEEIRKRVGKQKRGDFNEF